MAWSELLNRRTRTAKVFRDDITGNYRQLLSAHDQHYHDGAAWQDVDENLVDDGLDGFAKRCDKTRHTIRFGYAGQRRWYPRRNVETEYIGITNIQWWDAAGQGRWRNLNLPTPVWRSQGAEWDLSNLYASITNTSRQIKSAFILKNATAPSRMRFELVLVGLTLNAETWELTSTTDGQVWGIIAPPTAEDANGLNVPVISTFDGTYIEWSVDTTGAAYPINVDPTFKDGYGGDTDTAYDSNVQQSFADTEYSTAISLNVTGQTNKRFALYLFDFSGLPTGAIINSVTFTLFCAVQRAATGTMNFHRILAANTGWLEACTWNYADGAGASDRWAGDSGSDGGADAGCSQSGTDHAAAVLGSFVYTSGDPQGTQYDATIDLTEFGYVLSNNYGFILRTSATGAVFGFYSSDNGTTGYRPYVVVDYTADITVTPGAASAIASSANPTAVLGSVSSSPVAATSISATAAPTVNIAIPPIVITPDKREVIARTANPSVRLGSVTVHPAEAKSPAGVKNPTVIQSSITVTPSASRVITQTAAPTVSIVTTTLTPAAAGVIASTIAPNVVIAAMAVIYLYLTAYISQDLALPIYINQDELQEVFITQDVSFDAFV
jgi:hypothetical protein